MDTDPDRQSPERKRRDTRPPATPLRLAPRHPAPDLQSRERKRPDTRCAASLPGEPLAYLLTWTCYGTWLHGDERWSVDKNHNEFRGRSISPHRTMESQSRARMAADALVLTDDMRRVADTAIREHAAHRAWTIHALNVRTNHAHAVLAAPGVAPEPALVQLKAWATRALREAHLVAADARVWTEHGSTRWLWDEEGVRQAVEYVNERQ